MAKKQTADSRQQTAPTAKASNHKFKVGNTQLLVNAQVDINRAVFEVNRERFPKGHYARKKADVYYLNICVTSAINSLRQYQKEVHSSVDKTGSKLTHTIIEESAIDEMYDIK